MVVRELRVSVGRHQHHSQRRAHTDHVAKQGHARRIRPVHIIEDQQQRLVFTCTLEQARDGGVQQVALGLRITLLLRGQIGNPVAQGAYEAPEVASETFDMRVKDLLRCLLDEAPQGLHPRLVGNAEILLTASIQHGRTLAMHLQRQLLGQASLTDTGLTPYQCWAQRPAARLPPQLSESLALGDPAHIGGSGELTQPLGQRDAGDRSGRPLKFECLNRLEHTLQLEAAKWIEAMTVACPAEPAHQGVDHDLPARRMSAESRSLDHRLAEVVAVLYRGLPEAHADAHAERFLGTTVARLDGLLHLDRACQ